ncbi:hypothetical protein GQR42_05835 [Microcystis aeruginosa FD4]|uniref:Uncharacterized protein n=1 Tax=Microcystis aeruginosa FD4 TaxID=2686288 RepID=A0A857D0G4_MICAE|nr:hypothetical protein GQR42_05835 [Microcystis aeruginosa FD4]
MQGNLLKSLKPPTSPENFELPFEGKLGTCALIMYLLGERSSPLHCGQNPLLSGCLEPAPSARRGFADHPKQGESLREPPSNKGLAL